MQTSGPKKKKKISNKTMVADPRNYLKIADQVSNVK